MLPKIEISIDGSSNIDRYLSVGSIFAIRQQQGEDLDGTAQDLLQESSKQIAAGYILDGASTGTTDILAVVPDKIHARTPLIIGSKEDVSGWLSLMCVNSEQWTVNSRQLPLWWRRWNRFTTEM